MLRDPRWDVSPGFVQRHIETQIDLAAMRRHQLETELCEYIRELRTEQAIKRWLDRALYPFGLKVVRIPGRWPGGRLIRMGT
jgi:hypothetical protein